MRIMISDRVFSGSVSTMKLNHLAGFALSGRHRLIVENDRSPGFLSWLATLGPSLVEEWNEALNVSSRLDSIHPSLIQINVIDGTVSNWQTRTPSLTIDDAINVCTRSFRVVVENNRYDRGFLLSVAAMEQRQKLLALERSGFMEFQQGGGINEILEWVKYKIASGTDLKSLCFIIFDGDARYPDEPSPTAIELYNVLKNNDIPRHRLQRRAIENYLPTETLRHWVRKGQRGERKSRENKLKAYCDELTASQKHYYNLKLGFGGDRADSSKAKDLYDNLNASTTQHLERGFGKRISAYFREDLIRVCLQTQAG
jgi:hypothetical protein